MIISIASGKGGTGKTTIATNLALSIEKCVQLLDCDVEEPNAHLFIKPKILSKESVFISLPKVNDSKCTFCGKCAKICAFNAILVVPGKVSIFSELCHGCGACRYFCPENAIEEVEKEIGILMFGKKGHLQFVYGQLNVGEVIAVPLIKAVKKHIHRSNTVIIDAPPGTSCPVIESVRGSDFCVLVTEPTPFGMNDLILAVEMLRKMNIPFGVVINRSDLGNHDVNQYCARENIPVLMQIPYSQEIATAYSNGIPLITIAYQYQQQFLGLMQTIKEVMS